MIQARETTTIKKIGIVMMLSAALVLTAGAALAATATGNMNVSASVAANCRITGVTDITFGTAYDPTDPAANDSGSGDFTFRCTKNTAYGLYIAGTRTMTDGTDTLNFELYEDAGRTTVYDSASPGNTATAASNGPVTENVYGRIPALQDVGVGAYAGSVTVTVEY